MVLEEVEIKCTDSRTPDFISRSAREEWMQSRENLCYESSLRLIRVLSHSAPVARTPDFISRSAREEWMKSRENLS